MDHINVLAVIVAASSLLVGGLWYSPTLFGKIWNRENGSDPKAGAGHPAKVFDGSARGPVPWSCPDGKPCYPN